MTLYAPAPVELPKQRRAVTVIGVIFTVVGVLAAGAAVALMAIFGTSGSLRSGTHKLTSATSAMVLDVSHIQNTNDTSAIIGSPTVQLSAGGGGAAGVFIGIGPRQAVDNYLANAAYDEVSDLTLNPFDIDVDRHPGTMTVTPPDSQTFWVASSTSATSAYIDWRMEDGDYRVVIMNADGSPNLVAQGEIGLTAPNMFRLSVATFGVGLLVLVGGVLLLILPGTRRPSNRGDI